VNFSRGWYKAPWWKYDVMTMIIGTIMSLMIIPY
jgi:hypothetical protein